MLKKLILFANKKVILVKFTYKHSALETAIIFPSNCRGKTDKLVCVFSCFIIMDYFSNSLLKGPISFDS